MLVPFHVAEPPRETPNLAVHMSMDVPPAQPDGRPTHNGTTIAVSTDDLFWLRDQYGSIAVADPDLSVWRCWSRLHELVPESFPANRWLMLALWGYLTLRGGAYLHGAVCVIAGRFVLLLGDSGVGKSTLSRLVVAAGGTCLTDENPFVTLDESGRPRVHGSPRPGVDGPPVAVSGSLDAVFFLRHAPHNDLGRLEPSATGRRLVGNARFFHWLPETIPRTMTMLAAIAATTPIFDFGFVPDGSAVEVVRETLDRAVGSCLVSR